MSFYPIHPVRFAAHWNNGAYKDLASAEKPKGYWSPNKFSKYRDIRAALSSPSAATGVLNTNYRISKSYAQPEARRRTTPVIGNLGIDTPKRFTIGSGTSRRIPHGGRALPPIVFSDNKAQQDLRKARKTLKTKMLSTMGSGTLSEVNRKRMFKRVQMLGFMNEEGDIDRMLQPKASPAFSPEEIVALREKEIEVGPSRLKQDQTMALMEDDGREEEQEGAIMDSRCRRIVQNVWMLVHGP
ncbi:hypothetical protein BDV96DRAFT_648676 [Lophiotrema nucula]|uniref:Uncharacterized protein n=1 Tax=Lophiotrema nucula TaxID=690887 RepID=A0A6A5Z0S7_9PLEO|nr:hypothetical protein BDV96DRAFT_648676 [Lophiotrema nucula]